MLIMSTGKREQPRLLVAGWAGERREGRGKKRRQEGRGRRARREGAGRKEGRGEKGEEEGGEEGGVEEGRESIPKLTTSNTLRALSSAAVHSSRPSPVTATDVTLPAGKQVTSHLPPSAHCKPLSLADLGVHESVSQTPLLAPVSSRT